MWDRLCGVKADRSGTYGGDRCEGTRRQGAHITPSNYRVAKNPSITTRPVGLTISLRTAPTFKSLAISPVRDYFRPQIPHGPIISDNTVRLAGLESERGYSFCLDSLVWSSHPSSLPLSLSLSLSFFCRNFASDRTVSLHIVNWLFHHDRDRPPITVIFVRNAFV